MEKEKNSTKKKRPSKSQRTHTRRVKQAERKERSVTINPGSAPHS
jgi:hypothetical protein